MQLTHPLDPNSTRTIVQVLDSLGTNRGGLTRAVFERFRLVSKNTRALLITVAYQPNIRDIFEGLIKDGSIPQHTEMLNYYEDQRQRTRKIASTVDTPHQEWEASHGFVGAVERSRTGSLTRFFKEGVFVGLISRDEQGVIRGVEKHDASKPWIREYRDSMWADGTPSKREYYDELNRPRYRIFVSPDSKPYLSVWVNENGYEYRSAEHLDSGTEMRGDTRSGNAAWLTRKLLDLGQSTIFTDEPRTTFALAVGGPNINHITSIHTTHYKNNQDSAGGIKYWVNHYCENFDRIGSIVFFTDAQRRDFIEDTGCPKEKTRVIPHAAPLSSASALPRIGRHPRRLVAVSRLAEDKRLDHAIRAFAKASKSIPDAEFQIYGSGKERGYLAKLIEDLGVENSVFLAGHTDKPLECFASGTASILTSKYEGFGLVITESLAVGTPVIAYSVIYGPREVIKDGVNGFLCPDGDIESLASGISLALKSDKMSDSLRDAATLSASKFSWNSWATGWLSTVTEEYE